MVVWQYPVAALSGAVPRRHSGAWETAQDGPSTGQGKSGTVWRLKSVPDISVVIFADVARFAQRAHKCGAAMSDISPERHRTGLQAAPCHPSPSKHKLRATGWLETVQGASGKGLNRYSGPLSCISPRLGSGHSSPLN